MKKLWMKIGVSFISLFFIVIVCIGFVSGEFIRTTYIENKEKELQDDARILIESSRLEDSTDLQGDGAALQKQLMPFNKKVDARITVINKNGKVLADTKKDPAKLENHANRPEVRAILKSGEDLGVATHRSHTLGYGMLYVAVPILHNDQITGVVRVSVSLDSVEKAVFQLWENLAIVFGVAIIIIALISLWIARRVTKPVQEIIEVSENLAQHRYNSRIRGRASGELQNLAISVNALAESLESQMQAIKQNEQRLTAVLQNLVSGVMLINNDKMVIMTNKMMYELLDTPSIAGKYYYEVIKSFALTQLVEAAIQTKSLQREEITLYFPKEMTLDANVSPILTDQGEITGLILLLHDITQIKHLENVRTEFVTNVSHELKTPVTALKGFAETLLDGAMYDEALLKKFLGIMKDESDRLHRLILDILALSRIEQHALPINQEVVDIYQTITEAAQTVTESAKQKNIDLVLPHAAKPLPIETDNDKLKQIIINLVSNAVAYTPENGTVKVDVEESTHEVLFTVADNGIGIPAKEIERVFERFYRVDKARSRHSGGTGLGLSIVKHLTEQLGGRIEVASVEGEGTTFSIHLPKTK